MPDPELIKYIRTQRKRFPDEQIRERLLQDGLDADDIDEAFAVAVGETRKLGAAAKALIAGALLFVGGFFLIVLSYLLPSGGGKKAPARTAEGDREMAELKAFEPEPLSAPTLIEPYLPAVRTEGNAGEDYEKAGEALLAEGAQALQGLMAGAGPDEARDAAAIAAVERAASKRENRLTGVVATPDSLPAMLEAAKRTMAVSTVATVFRLRADKLRAEGRAQAADAELRKLFAVGYHLMQDWDTTAQLLGAASIMSAAVPKVKEAHDRGDREEWMRLAKLIKQLKAYLPEADELARIESEARDPGKAAGLSRYFSDDKSRRAYGAYALLSATVQWSEGETASGTPSPRRVAPLTAAAAGDDPRLAALGRGYASAVAALAKELQGLPRAERAKRVGEYRAAVAKAIPTGLLSGS